MKNQQFTFSNIKEQYESAIKNGYKIYTCSEYVLNKDEIKSKAIINRVDVDFSVKKARQLGQIFNDLGIKATFFVRLHAPEYNLFSFENYRIVKWLIESGHEIGYHSEVVDQATIWDEDAAKNLIRDVNILNEMFQIRIKGTASHGGMTGWNNLSFWKSNKSKDFGLLYEAYDWFDDTFYLSDSEWTRWKCYKKGSLQTGDQRSLKEHIEQGNEDIIYLLIHSDTYFNNHFYEEE